MAPVVAPSTIAGGAPLNVRSASYSVSASVRQSKQPTRTRALAASRRGCRFGDGGFEAMGFGWAHPATPTIPTITSVDMRHSRIRLSAIRGGHAVRPTWPLDTGDGKTVAAM